MNINRVILVTIIFFTPVCYSLAQKTGAMLKVIELGMSVAEKQSVIMAKSMVGDAQLLPRSTDHNGELITSDASWWCSGFFPGVLWYLYANNPSAVLKKWAENYTYRVENQKYTTDNHDIGFIIFCSFGNGYRLTRHMRYREVIDSACMSLCTRYNPIVKAIRSWDFNKDIWQFPVIIDNMMNLDMLMWASQELDNKYYAKVAVNHAKTTLKNHFRLDHSSYHVVSYDTITGAPHIKQTFQGYSDSSSWSRGQAWGLYGYTMMYRYTRDEEFLKQAKNIAEFIIHHPRLPKDKIPYWDFDAPNIPDAYRDASAGAIICSALIELSTFVERDLSKKFLTVAEEQLRTLSSPDYLAKPGTNGGFILKHSVGYLRANSEVDVPLAYADYYYVEAMTRYKNLYLEQYKKHL